MATKSKSKKYVGVFFRTGKADLIREILLGKGEKNVLNEKESDDYKPERMKRKLSMIEANSSDNHVKARALKAIELLSLLPSKSLASEANRRRILNAVKDL